MTKREAIERGARGAWSMLHNCRECPDPVTEHDVWAVYFGPRYRGETEAYGRWGIVCALEIWRKYADVLRNPEAWKLHTPPDADEVAETAVKLARYARTLHRLAENDCNVGLTRYEEKQEAATEERVTALCRLYGWEVQHNGDPRGFAYYIHFPYHEEDGRPAWRPANSWGGQEHGYGVPD
jgi:hypothetical protein